MKIIILGMLIMLVFSVHAEMYHHYKIDLKYDQGEISYTTLKVEPSIKVIDNPGSDYIAEVINFDNKGINLTFFGIPTEILYDNWDPETGEIIGGGLRILNESEATIYIPYYENAKEIRIYDMNLKKKLTIPVDDLAKEIATVDAEIKQTELTEDEVEKEEKSSLTQPLTGVLLGVGIIILLIVIIVLIKRKKP